MSKFWGPLGWMTLHSISLIYPESPTPTERYIANRFLDLFAETISCNDCKVHFKSMFTLYKLSNPEFLNSRQDFALFIFRAHNTVNRRLDKPIHTSVADCIRALKNATVHTSLAQFRQAYLNYLMGNWGRETTGDGAIAQRAVRELIKINNEYWSPRDIPIPDLKEGNVLAFIERINNTRITPSGTISSTAVGFKGGRLRLMNW